MRFFTIILGCLMFYGCGQDPSFLEEQARFQSRSDGNDTNGSGSSSTIGDATPADGSPTDLDSDETNGSVGGPDGTSDLDADGNPDGSQPESFDIPDAHDGDVADLNRCLKKFKDLPFGKTINNFRKIYASVSVGGFGLPINDTQTTQDPELVLIYAGVNVGGAPTWNLMNPNAYYCMKVNVNVNTDFTINLACDAGLADSAVNVNVGSQQNNNVSRVGVHVNSKITVVGKDTDGSSCSP